MNYKLDIILPVYNEEENIEHVIEGIEKFVKTPHRILAIWQDPKDPSIKVLKKIKKNTSSLVIVQSNNGIGLLNALKTGFENMKSDIIVITMSDLSDNPHDIDKMIAKIDKGYDMVCASRYMSGGKRIGGSKLKAFLSWATCITLHYIVGIPTKDSTNAFKCFRREIIENIKIESKNGYEFPLELVTKSYKAKYKITEIPTVWRERGKGYSKFNILKLSPFYLKWYRYAIGILIK